MLPWDAIQTEETQKAQTTKDAAGMMAAAERRLHVVAAGSPLAVEAAVACFSSCKPLEGKRYIGAVRPSRLWKLGGYMAPNTMMHRAVSQASVMRTRWTCDCNLRARTKIVARRAICSAATNWDWQTGKA